MKNKIKSFVKKSLCFIGVFLVMKFVIIAKNRIKNENSIGDTDDKSISTMEERNEIIDKSLLPHLKMLEVYDYVGRKFTLDDEHHYCLVSIPGDKKKCCGYFDLDKMEEVVPCNTYLKINDKFFNRSGDLCCHIKNSYNDYIEEGIYNITDKREEIPSDKYKYIGPEFIEDGTSYRAVSIPHDNGYQYGYYNMDTLEEEVPCKSNPGEKLEDDIYRLVRKPHN